MNVMSSYTINLNGPQGNAYYLLGVANVLGKQLNMSVSDRQKLVNEMKSKDYAHLLEVFKREFGSFVELVNESDV